MKTCCLLYIFTLLLLQLAVVQPSVTSYEDIAVTIQASNIAVLKRIEKKVDITWKYA